MSNLKLGMTMIWQGVKNGFSRPIFERPLYVFPFDTGGCGGCQMALSCMDSFPYATEHQGGVAFTSNPSQADVLLLTGALCRSMIPILGDLWRQIPEPKGIITIGACTTSSNIFGENYAVLGDFNDLASVDLTIEGCPPSPQAILDGIAGLLSKAST